MTNSKRKRTKTDTEPVWHSWGLPARVIASICLSYHVLAMFVSPWAIPPTSQLAVSLQQYVAHYQTILYLNHGYRFFAPDPGPANLIEFQITRPDGSTLNGLFPDRQAINRSYPRLNYHRWFMWSETLGQLFGQWATTEAFNEYLELGNARVLELREQGLEIEANRLALQLEEDQRLWQNAENDRQQILTPVARHLLERNAGVEIRLTLNRRLIPSLSEARTGMRPSDTRLLDPERAFELGRWRKDETSGSLQPLEPTPMTELESRSGETMPALERQDSHD